jgi:hypothetical protein
MSSGPIRRPPDPGAVAGGNGQRDDGRDLRRTIPGPPPILPPSSAPSSSVPMAPALSGDLARFRVHDLCQLLGLAQATGRLYLRAPGVHGVIAVESGTVVGARIQPNPERLGRILRRSGAVTATALEHAVSQQVAGDHRALGTILVAGGGMAGEALARALEEQGRAALSALLVLPAGRFAFLPGPVASAAGPRLDFESLLFQALTRLDELDPARIPPE